MTVPKPRGSGDDGAERIAEVAVEDLELALARLQWAESCTCVRTAEQCAALRWHEAQVTSSRARVTDAR
jgi:hypothetical protein